MANLFISREGAAVLEELYQLHIKNGEEHSLKLDAGSGFMPVVVETMRLFDATDRKVISVAHYFEMNGDLCADPYMEFLRFPAADGSPQYMAIRYKTEGSILARDRDSVILNDHTGVPEKYAKQAATQDRVFATQWMRNIAVQQNLKTKVRVQ